MRLVSRALATLGLLLATVGVVWISPGQADAVPWTVLLTDPAGDASAVGGVASDPAYDIRGLAFTAVREHGIQVLKAALTLEGTPSETGTYLVSFDVPGCTTPPAAEGATKQGGVFLRVDRTFYPARTDTFVDCHGTGPLQGKSEEATYTVAGNVLTWTVPYNEIIRAGEVLTAPAVTTSTVVGRDSTVNGSDYAFPVVPGDDAPEGPQMWDQRGDVANAAADVVSLTFTTTTVNGTPVVGILVETAEPIAPGIGVRVVFDLPGCNSGLGTAVLAHVTYGVAGQQATVVCQLTGQTDAGSFRVGANVIELDLPLGAGKVLQPGAVVSRPSVSTEGPGEATALAYGLDRTAAGRPYEIGTPPQPTDPPGPPGETDVVAECGAVPDGVTDNWLVLQSCISLAARTGRSLYFPPGTYNVAGTLNLVDDAFRIRGANRETTQIVETLAGSDLFLAKAANGNPLNQLTMQSLRLSYASTSATGTALRCENCWRTFVQDMNFGTVDSRTSVGTGISAVGGNQLHIVSSNFSTPVTRAIYAAKVRDLYLQDLEINLSEGSAQLGVVLDTDVTGIYATNVNVTAGKIAFVFQETLGGQPPSRGFFTNCLADTENGPGGIGWDFESAQSMVLTNSWAASATTTGILANGVDGLTIDAGRIYNNGGVGISVGPGAKNVAILGSRIAGNSRLNSGAAAMPAVLLRAGADDVQLQNNRIGAQDSFANTQSYAVEIQDGYGDTLQLTGNHLLNNLRGGIDNHATTGPRWVTEDNV